MESIMKLESLISDMTEIVNATDEVEFNLKLAPNKWSKKKSSAIYVIQLGITMRGL